ncbi:MAG: OmpA family protein [Planctomycetota bacterium]
MNLFSARATLPTSPQRIASRLGATGCVCLLVLTAGCTQNPYLAGGSAWQPSSTVGPNGFAVASAGNPAASNLAGGGINPVQAQIAELNRRVQLLDDNNRQLTTQLAQSEQQSQVYRDELSLVREQLADTTRQYESARIVALNAQQNARSFQASAQLRGGATIRANTNLAALASRLNLGNLPVTPDGGVIRITVPADQLFQPGTPNLLPQATTVLDPVAAQLRSIFPRQRIGIEGYTDAGPAQIGGAAGAHQLTSAQAATVLDVLTRRGGMPANQLFMVAHGSNNPRQDNATPAGRAVNRRIELVVYPETF